MLIATNKFTLPVVVFFYLALRFYFYRRLRRVEKMADAPLAKLDKAETLNSWNKWVGWLIAIAIAFVVKWCLPEVTVVGHGIYSVTSYYAFSYKGKSLSFAKEYIYNDRDDELVIYGGKYKSKYNDLRIALPVSVSDTSEFQTIRPHSLVLIPRKPDYMLQGLPYQNYKRLVSETLFTAVQSRDDALSHVEWLRNKIDHPYEEPTPVSSLSDFEVHENARPVYAPQIEIEVTPLKTSELIQQFDQAKTDSLLRMIETYERKRQALTNDTIRQVLPAEPPIPAPEILSDSSFTSPRKIDVHGQE